MADNCPRLEETADAGLIAGLWQASYRGTAATVWPLVEIAKTLRQPATLALIGGPAGGPAGGFILARQTADEGEILALGTLPQARRQGLALSLVGHLRDHLAARGAGRLFLEVAVDNAAARALYGRCGFAVVGSRPGYYKGAGGLIMALDLSAEREG